MRKLALTTAAALLAVLPLDAAGARPDADRREATSPHELVVFEADGCIYCETFRTDALPLYRSSQLGRIAPIRFVNVSRSDETRMGLANSITIVPTIVLLHQGQEVDRIVGYPGPGNLMTLVNHMLGRRD